MAARQGLHSQIRIQSCFLSTGELDRPSYDQVAGRMAGSRVLRPAFSMGIRANVGMIISLNP